MADDADLLDHAFMSEKIFNPAEKASIRLLQIMHQNRIPLCLFDKLVCAVRDAEKVDGFSFSTDKMPPRDQVINKIAEKMGIDGLQPRSKTIVLEGTDTVVQLITHDFKESVYSLLSDPELMKEENLLFPKNMCPFSIDDIDTGFTIDDIEIEAYDDIDTGTDYINAYKMYCKVRDRDFLCPIIIFIDKTHTDAKGRLKLEQVTFTLGIFNRETRYHANAWRVLGSVPDQSYHTKAKTSLESMKDYHHLLREIFKEVQVCQQDEDMGFYWNIMKNGEQKTVLLKMPILFAAGDSEGHDKLCGKYRGANISRICRYCNVESHEISSPTEYYKFTLTTKKMVQDALHSSIKLKEMSQHNLINAFYDLKFCNEELNIHGACPAEVTHCHQHGICPKAVEALLTLKKAPERIRQNAKKWLENKVALINEKEVYEQVKKTKQQRNATSADTRKRKRIGKDEASSKDKSREKGPMDEVDAIEDDSFVYERASDAEQSKYFVFSKQKRAVLDDYSKLVGRELQHQSDRDIPRCYFGMGVSTNASKNCHEEQGVLLLLYFSLCSGLAWQWIIDMGFSTYNIWVDTIQQLMALEETLKSNDLTPCNVNAMERYIPFLMDKVKRAMNRQTGMGFNFLKAHLPLHYSSDIRRFGSAENYSGGPGETRHKSLAKSAAATTQKRASVFDQQCATRLFQHVVVSRAHYYVCRSIRQTGETLKERFTSAQSENLYTLNECADTKPKNCGGKTYIIRRDGTICHSKYYKHSPAQWVRDEQMNIISSYVKDNIYPYINEEICELRMFTEYRTTVLHDKQKQIIYRAHPCYKSTNGYMEWLDWFYYDNEELKCFIPCRVNIFLEIKGLKDNMVIESAFEAKPHTKSEVISSDGIVAICNVGKDMVFDENGKVFGTKISPESDLIQCGELVWDRRKRELQLATIPVSKLTCPCIAVRRKICLEVNPDGYYPNRESKKAENNEKGYLFLLPRRIWKKWLVNKMNTFLLDLDNSE
jgi:hypothetical protein